MSTLLTSPQPQCSASHISVILFQVSNYVPISTAVTEASLIEWDASWSRRTSFLQDLEGKRLSAFQNRGHLYPWTSPCVHLPCCHQSRSSRHEDRGGLPLASCTLIITKQLCLRAPGAQSYWWWSSLKSSGWLWALKTLCVERILYGSITSYPTLSSSVHTATAARSLPSVWVSPGPCASWGDLQYQALWSVGVGQSQKGVWLCCPAFAAVPLGTARSLSFQQSTDLLSGEVPGAQLQFSSSWSLPTGWPYNFTAGYSVSWGCILGLLKGDFGETFEVGFRSSSWGYCQYYFLMAGYDHEDD